MPYPVIDQPVPCPEAFEQSHPQATQSQAALLLLLGMQLRGDAERLSAQDVTGSSKTIEDVLGIDSSQFPIPHLVSTGERYFHQDVQDGLIKEHGLEISEGGDGKRTVNMPPEVMSELAQRLYQEPSPRAAADLLGACIWHSDELVRVAASASHFELLLDPYDMISSVAQGTYSQERLVQDVAMHALGHMSPQHPRFKELLAGEDGAGNAEPSHSCLLVHGTFARTATWWQPGGDFHTYLRTSFRPDVYNGSDRFSWSGGYSDEARLDGANQLYQWVTAHNLQGLDIFAHSHGCSVSMLANQAGLKIGELVLLSCPVHIPKYAPNFTEVSKVVSIRVHLDLAILADRGGQIFRDPRIQEHVLPIWFDHSSTHYPETWQKYNLPSAV